ncbi:MAG: phosphatase PAP2 family protein [Planctomycetaceae bacterium]
MPEDCFSFKEDAHDFLPMIWEDACSVVNRENLLILGIALGGAIAVRQDIDGEARDYTSEHPNRWGEGSEYLGKLAEPQYQIPVMFGIYSWSLYQQDAELHEFSKSLISAYTVASVTTLTIKAIANTDRPSDDWNNGQYGFPSYHTSSSFAIAAVVEEYYGWKAGATAYTVAGLIGWSRLDERDHDLSDVLFGAALGCVIGKTIAQHHLDERGNLTCYPYLDPAQGSSGVMFNYRY